MLSKVLAGLVASMAVAFAGYSMVHDSSKSHCCSGSMVSPVVTEASCCEEAMPSCCESTKVVEATCPACPAMKEAACTLAKEKATTVEDK